MIHGIVNPPEHVHYLSGRNIRHRISKVHSHDEPPQMLNYAESFGLVIFVYALGLQVGPGFFSSFRKGGVQLNMLATGVVLIGTLLTVLGSYGLGVSLPDMVGILCGATTNTPALGAAQQTLKQMGLESSTPALGCAVANCGFNCCLYY